MGKFILTESEKNEIKSLYKSKGLLIEISDPKNADSYPDKDKWTMQDWKTFYAALNKKWGDRDKARAQFLDYWEPLEASWMDEPAQDEMDNDNSFFRLEGMWNEDKKRPFTKQEFLSLEGDRCIWGDCRNGKGYKEFGGNKYVGEFKDGLANGKGMKTWWNGDKYEGDFKDGQPNGKGKKNWFNGDNYEGDFEDDEPNGKGMKTWSSGTKYEGDFKDGQPNGIGTYNWVDNSKYEGDVKNSQPNGIGTYTNKNGIKYTGEWLNYEPIGTDLDTLNNLSTQEEADQLMNQIASGSNQIASGNNQILPPDASDAGTSSSSINETDCASLFADAERQTNYNPQNLRDGKVVIGKGNQGPLVKAMQCYLNEKNQELNLGLTPLKVDSIFGNKTKEMTIKFQEQFPGDLIADGIIGKNTYAKLNIGQ